MGRAQMNRTVQDMLYLIACALHGRAPKQEWLMKMDLDSLYKLAKYHAITAIVCMALESGNAFSGVEPALVKQWQSEKNKAIRKNILLDAECQEIFKYMEDNGIWYMPLKGAVLKDLYPQYGMRQMADYDILFDPTASERMRKYMEARGYEAESFGKGNHDAYIKPPIYNFELHRELFGTAHNTVWRRYYSNIRERLVPEGRCRYRFRDEDFYIYITTHACKHYEGAGTGLRFLIDCYVYCRELEDNLDWDYIQRELDNLGITEFERTCHELAVCLLSEPDPCVPDKLTGKQREMLDYFISSGTYGTTENLVGNKLRILQADGENVSIKTRLRYLWRRLFPDMNWFRSYVPVCYHHKWTIPFYLIFRVLRGVILRNKRIWQELRAMRKSCKNSSMTYGRKE